MTDDASAPPPAPGDDHRRPVLASPADGADELVRLGVVSFVNTLPLVAGLDGCEDLEVRPSALSLLLDRLVSGDADVALCSCIDY